MKKHHQLLIGLLGLQIVLAIVVFWPRSAPAAAGVPLLGGLKADDVTALTVSDGQGKSIRLSKASTTTASGEPQWVLPDAEDYPVEANKVPPLLTKLVNLKASRLATQTAASHKRLQVADDNFVRRLDIQTADGITRTLYLGSSAGARTVHVRVAGQNEVYLANDLATWELGTDATSWANPIYFSVIQNDVITITLRNANGEWTFEKDAAGNWTMQGLAPGESLNTNNVIGLLSRVSSVRMTQPLGKTEDPSYGMLQPSAVVTVTTRQADQQRVATLTIGALDNTSQTYVVKSSESAFYARVSKWVIEDLVQKTREGFLNLPPTPTPEATPTPAAG
jgi:hypothetical protein